MATPSSTPAKKILRWIPGLLALAILIFSVSAHQDDGKKILQVFKSMDPVWILAAVGFQAGTYMCSALVWKWTLKNLGTSLSLGTMMKLGIKKLFTDQVIPAGGIAGTALITRSLLKKNIPTETTTTGVLANFYSYYAAYTLSVLLSLVALWQNQSMNPAIQKISFFFFILVLCIVWLGWQLTHSQQNFLSRWLGKKQKIKKALDILQTASPKTATRPLIFLPNVLFQMGVFILDTATLSVFLTSIGYSIHFPLLFASFMMCYVVETLGPIPGGLGVFESSSVAMLSLAHIPLSPALAATLLLRGFTFWLPLIFGLFFLRSK